MKPYTKSIASKLSVMLPALVAALIASAIIQKPAFTQSSVQDAATKPAERFDFKSITRSNSKSAPPENIASPVKQGPALPQAVENTTNYSFATTTTASLTNMSSGTTQLLAANIDDTASALTNIGFDFYFQGARFTQFSINDNGVLRLGAAAQGGAPYQPLAQAAIPIITAYGADQRTHAGDGKVHFKVTGAAPNRVLVVEWLNNQANFNAGGTADLTYQVRLSETTGIIEFVYGSMTMSVAGAASADSSDPNIGFSSTNTAGNVGSVTAAQSGTPAPTYNGASATPVANVYTAGAITVLTSVADGSRRNFNFTPPTPTAPTALTFTGITPIAMTLNWADSADETIYAVYRSTDGVNFTFDGTAAQNATSFNASGLTPSTTYFWRVFAVSEGALSTALSGSQASAAAANIMSTPAGGNWSAPATWVGGVVPTATDNVTIVDGSTVTIDVTTATCLNLTVGQGTSGVLQYISTPASTLTVNTDATVATGGTFTAGAGSLTTHVLNIGGNNTASAATGNLTVNGTFDMNTTAGVTTNFFGTANATVSGAGATCDFFAIVGQKGTTNAAILDVTRVITMNAPAASANRLAVTTGTIKLSSASTITPYFGSQTVVGANGRLWLNNAGASVQCVGTGTGTGAGSPTITGTLQVDAGTWGYGSGNNALSVGGTLIMGGASATINMFGSFTFAANSTFTMTGGNINIDPQAANSLAAANNLLRFTGPNTVSATGGTMTIVDPHAATGAGRALSISTNSGTYNFVGSTIRFGNGVSTTAGSVDGFDIDTFVGNLLVAVGNVVVDNTATNAATRFVRANTAVAPLQMIILGDLTITGSGGSRFNLNGNLVAFGKDIINNGTIDGTTAGSILYWLGNGVASTYSGTGTSLAPLVEWDVDNPLGVTLNPGVSNVVVRRIDLFTGGLTNANKLTLGNGDATVSVIQIGNGTTPTAAGSFDVAPTFNLGTGGENALYARETASSRTTGPEINPGRTLNLLSYDDNDVTHTLTIAGGDLTLSSAATALALTNGRVITGANTLILSSGTATVTRTTGLVDGNLRKTYAAAANKSFEVGTANGFSPVAVNVTSGTFPATFTVKAVQGPQPNILDPTKALQRYWTLTGTGVTADLTFNYLDLDVPGTATESLFFIWKFDGSFTAPGGTVNTVANTASIIGVTSFSDWTLAEPAAPTDVHLVSFTADSFTDDVSLSSLKGGGHSNSNVLRWQTGYEAANLGFNIYRDENGSRTRVTPDLIAGSALFVGARTVLGAGRSYAWRDTQGQPGPDAQYWLEAMNLDGSSTWHGPIKSVASGKQLSALGQQNSRLIGELNAGASTQDTTAPVETAAKLGKITTARFKTQAAITEQLAIKMSVKQEGWYRVGQPELVAAGFNPNVDPNLLQLFVDGQEQPLSVIQKNGKFDMSSAIEFYGMGLNAASADARVYWLVAGTQPGKRIQQIKSVPGSPTTGGFPYTVERRDRTIYFSSLLNGDKENFFGAVVARDPVDQSLTLRHLQPSGGQATLEIALQGVTLFPHRVKAQINGTDAGEIMFAGQSQGVGRFTIQQSLLKEGQNQVKLTPLGGPSDICLVDYIRVTYQRAYTADNNVLRLTATGSRQVTIDGFNNNQIRVFDITTPSAVREVSGTIQQQKSNYSITFTAPDTNNRTLLALTNDQAARAAGLAINRPSSLRQPVNGADLLIISRRDFLSSLEPLRTARQKQGLSVVMVDIEDIYAEFSYGQKTPQALKDFLYYAKTTWKKAPRFALLAADASYDPKNYLGFGNSDFVPTKLIDTQLMETFSDSWLADFDGDGVEDMALGRLPIRNAQQAANLAAKIISYDQTPPSEIMLLVADKSDTYNFRGANGQLRTLIPSNLKVLEIDRSLTDDFTAKAQLLEAVSRGPKVVNYTGHGSVSLWRGSLLASEDMESLGNSQSLSLFVTMTCLNGYFADPAVESLAESLMNTDGGAVAVWASSGMTMPDVQTLMNQEAYRQLFAGGGLTLGQAMAKAKAAVGNSDIRQTWILFGDPTSRLR